MHLASPTPVTLRKDHLCFPMVSGDTRDHESGRPGCLDKGLNGIRSFCAWRFFYLMMTTPTYNLFFTGRDDPRSCVIIGEDTKPVYFCFETSERNLIMSNTRTIVSLCSGMLFENYYIYCIFYQVYKNNKEVCAKLEWSGTAGNHLGVAFIGSREIPMSHLALPGSCTRWAF